MTKLWFVMPVYGRPAMTGVCLRYLARLCEALGSFGITATAVVVGDDENLDVARSLGFGVIQQDNTPLGRKWNDGFQAACDPDYNGDPADFVMPLGSDDWIDPALILSAPKPKGDEITCFKRGAFVDETGTKLARVKITYDGGFGLRLIPRDLIAAAGYRPCAEDKRRACDTSTLRGLQAVRRVRLVYHDLHELQIVDWKTRGNLNDYAAVQAFNFQRQHEEPWVPLSAYYDQHSLDEMRAVYA